MSTEKAISEKFSEKQPKRGRPRATVPEWDDRMTGIGFVPKDVTRRTVVNRYWMFRGCVALQGGAKKMPKRFAWLCPGKRLPRKTVLSELGRIGDAEGIRAMASALCKKKPATADALTMIKAFRLLRGTE